MTGEVRRLVLMRHAKSEYPPGVADHDRPLSERGRRDAPQAGRWLDDHVHWGYGPAPTILVSTATRAQATWTLASDVLPLRWDRCQRRDEPRVYEASVETLQRVVSETADGIETVIIVGHNPGLVDLIAATCTDDEACRAATAKFPTSAVAVLSTERSWPDAIAAPGGFRVEAFAVPRG